jgi:hypothetical protein
VGLYVTSSGSFNNTEQYLRKLSHLNILGILNKYGHIGVSALSVATPKESGRAAASWYYQCGQRGASYFIDWYNLDVEGGYKVVIGLQYGHGTGTGGYVQGHDFINPAMRPIFDEIANEVWKAVTSA